MAPTRRAVLTTLTATTAGLAGCAGLGGGGGGEGTTTGDGATATEGTTTSDGTTTGTGGTATGGDVTEVEMANTAFDPVRAEVAVGATVEWVNRDSFGHDVVSEQFHDAAASWDYDSGTLGSGETARYTFDSAGVYEYYCSIHGRSAMCGAVLVGDASLDGSMPCEDGGG